MRVANQHSSAFRLQAILSATTLFVTLCATLFVTLCASPANGQEKAGPAPRLAPTAERVFGSENLRGSIKCVTFSPDNRFAVTAGETIQFWDVTTGQLDHELLGSVGHFRAVQFSADGKRLAAAGSRGVLAIWDIEQSREILAVPGERASQESIFSVAFSPDGKRLVTASQHRIAEVWDAETGKLLNTLKLGGQRTAEPIVAFSPDGKHFVVSSETSLHVYESDSLRVVHVIRALEAPDMAGVAFRNNDEIVTAGGRRVEVDGQRTSQAELKFWDLDSGELIRTLPIRDRTWLSAMCLSADPRQATLHTQGKVDVLNLETGEIAQSFAIVDKTSVDSPALAVSSDGAMFAVASGRNLQLHDMKSGSRLLAENSGHDGFLISLSVSPDSRHVATLGHDGKVHVWETESREVIATFDQGGVDRLIRESAWSPDGRILYITGKQRRMRGSEGMLLAFDVQTKTKLFESELALQGMSAAVSSDGRRLAVATGLEQAGGGRDEFVIEICDARTGRATQQLAGELARSYGALKFSADGDLLYALPFSHGGALHTWDLNQGTAEESPLAITRTSFFVENSPRMAAITAMSRVEALEIPGMKSAFKLVAADRAFSNIAISADGKLLATHSSGTMMLNGQKVSNGDDTQVRIWEIDSGELLRAISGVEIALWQLKFSPDGQWLYGASPSGIAVGWQVEATD